jgi:hypothetical protein
MYRSRPRLRGAREQRTPFCQLATLCVIRAPNGLRAAIAPRILRVTTGAACTRHELISQTIKTKSAAFKRGCADGCRDRRPASVDI